MQRSSEESPEGGPPALTGEAAILVLPESTRQIEAEDSESADEPPQTSTLIEFPGVNRRSEPPWRKELSRRVREVQERRAKDTAELLVSVMNRQPPGRDRVLSQLELVPELPSPAMNQLVENALRRVERARRTDLPPSLSESDTRPVSRYGAATAAARAKVIAPIVDATDVLPNPLATPEVEPAKPARRSLSRRKLVIVPPPETKADNVPLPETKIDKSTAKPVRMIADGIEDTALSYLDDYFPESHSGLVLNQATFGRRTLSALCDFVIVLALTAPFAAGIELADGVWTDPLIILLLIAAISAVMIAYQTCSTALRGHTWGMRLLSIRAVDPRTGLIPTGGQSIRRALAYVFCAGTLGLGFFYTLVDSEHLAPHDRFSGTIVVRE
jgi:uncharacterized RDD family membrane protein YckC